MKKLIGLLSFAIIIAVSFAFGARKADLKMQQLDYYWYELTPGGNPNIPEDYVRVETQPCDGQLSEICGVFAEQFSSTDIEHPNLSMVADYAHKEAAE